MIVGSSCGERKGKRPQRVTSGFWREEESSQQHASVCGCLTRHPIVQTAGGHSPSLAHALYTRPLIVFFRFSRNPMWSWYTFFTVGLVKKSVRFLDPAMAAKPSMPPMGYLQERCLAMMIGDDWIHHHESRV